MQEANPGRGLPVLSSEEAAMMRSGAAELRRLRRMGTKLTKHKALEKEVCDAVLCCAMLGRAIALRNAMLCCAVQCALAWCSIDGVLGHGVALYGLGFARQLIFWLAPSDGCAPARTAAVQHPPSLLAR